MTPLQRSVWCVIVCVRSTNFSMLFLLFCAHIAYSLVAMGVMVRSCATAVLSLRRMICQRLTPSSPARRSAGTTRNSRLASCASSAKPSSDSSLCLWDGLDAPLERTLMLVDGAEVLAHRVTATRGSGLAAAACTIVHVRLLCGACDLIDLFD